MSFRVCGSRTGTTAVHDPTSPVFYPRDNCLLQQTSVSSTAQLFPLLSLLSPLSLSPLYVYTFFLLEHKRTVAPFAGFDPFGLWRYQRGRDSFSAARPVGEFSWPELCWKLGPWPGPDVQYSFPGKLQHHQSRYTGCLCALSSSFLIVLRHSLHY